MSSQAQRGLQLIEAAAAAGSAVGLTKLGVLYDEGASELTGGASDPWRAAKHFEAAAATGSALGLFNHGWALVHGIGTGRDVVQGLDLWREAAALAPEDGSEEAAYYLYEERHLMSDELAAAVRPARCLRLAAALGFDKAVQRLRRAERRRAMGPLTKERSGEGRFVRDDKARSLTAAELRGSDFF